MLKVYYLPVERIKGADVVKGIEHIHRALLECAEKPDVRKLIMDTSPDEDSALAAVALEVRDPTMQEQDALADLPPLAYQYEAFTKEITHPKRDTPIYVGYEVFEFDQELTPVEISELEMQLGKMIRKLE